MINMGNIPKKGDCVVKVTSPLTGEEYEGTFTWRWRTLEDLGTIAAVQSRLTEGEPIVAKTMEALIGAIAELSVVVESYPDWWEDIKDMADSGVILAVYGHYLRWRTEPFRSKKEKDKGGEASEG
jgi:hypothetical protein